jgi:predicted DNA-binding ribbon-helix-helix protein
MSKQTTVTSIRINEDLWKEAKKYAIDADVSLGELIEKLLKEELERIRKK